MHPSFESEETPTLALFVSDRLAAEAEAITERWVAAQIAQSDDASTSRGPEPSQLRDQILEVVRSVAAFARFPIEHARSEVVRRLRLHTERRREQGYDVQQLLTEHETLSRIVFAAFTDAVRAYPRAADPLDVADVAGRLREGLMEITSEAVGMYQQREVEQRRELAKRLADFADAISHELKNPLGAAHAGTQMLQEDNVLVTDEDRDRFTTLVLRNLVRMRNLIDDIRALTLANDAEGTARWVPLATVVETVFDGLRERAEEKGVSLELPQPLPDVAVDAGRLEIGLANLVGNAIKYSDPRKQDRWVQVRAGTAARADHPTESWEIAVADNGLGIPPALHGSVFRRHFRAHPERSEGTGFGLAITHELVAGRGGRIWFESVEGEGSTFHILIPPSDVLNESAAPPPGE